MLTPNNDAILRRNAFLLQKDMLLQDFNYTSSGLSSSISPSYEYDGDIVDGNPEDV